jgi:hypothetical protein
MTSRIFSEISEDYFWLAVIEIYSAVFSSVSLMSVPIVVTSILRGGILSES